MPEAAVPRDDSIPLPMNTTAASETLDVEQLFARGRAHAVATPSLRELGVEASAAIAFLAAAVAMALLIHSPRALGGPTLAVLIAAYVVACRAKFDFADGYTVPTELVLVPMLFLL